MSVPVNIIWFRRDLRLTDNAALYHALKTAKPVLPIYIFDQPFPDIKDVLWIESAFYIYNTTRLGK